jgi:hypothetical protein
VLGKLIKYDLKGMGRTLLPVQLGALLVGVMATAVLTATLRYTEHNYGLQGQGAGGALGGAITSFSILATLILCMVLFASVVVTTLLIARHYYNNLMGDEGYLSFTLPVSVHQHLLSKTVAGFIWSLINALVVTASLALLLAFGTAYSGLINREALGALAEGIDWLLTQGWGVLVFEYSAGAILSTIAPLLLIYASVTAGSILAKRHKIAAAVGVYFAAQMVLYTINSMAQGVIVTLMGINPDSMMSMMTPQFDEILAFLQITLLIGMAISILTIAAAYAFAHYALANRLNLE